MPLISIITPVYNNEKYICSAVESVFAQGIDDVEYIIVDDGSTDNTARVVDELAEKNDKIKVIHQNNQWIYASFNNGIKYAKGEYIYILNSDDKLAPGALKHLTEIVSKYSPDVIWTPVMVHECDSNQIITRYNRVQLGGNIVEDIYLENNEQLSKHWIYLDKNSYNVNQTNLYKRELALKHPFENNYYGEDYLFNIHLAPYIKNSYIMRTPVYEFFEYKNNNMNASVGKYYGYEHEMFNKIYTSNKELLKKWGIDKKDENFYYSKKRVRYMTTEIRALMAINCKLSLEEKIEKIFNEYIDEISYNAACNINAVEEYEARILSGIRTLIGTQQISKYSNYRFVYDLLCSLLRYEKNEQDYINIKNAVDNPYNKYRIGQTFFDKIKGGERFV